MPPRERGKGSPISGPAARRRLRLPDRGGTRKTRCGNIWLLALGVPSWVDIKSQERPTPDFGEDCESWLAKHKTTGETKRMAFLKFVEIGSYNLPARRSAINWLASTLALVLAACAGSENHDEALAAKRALEFAKVVLIERDFVKGHGMLADGGKRHVPLDKLKQTVASMHPRNYPNKITALEYEPMVGEKAIYIFLSGYTGEELISYRLTLEGTATTDYKVLKIDQGMGFPTFSNKKRPFKPAPDIS